MVSVVAFQGNTEIYAADGMQIALAFGSYLDLISLEFQTNGNMCSVIYLFRAPATHSSACCMITLQNQSAACFPSIAGAVIDH